MQYPGQGPRFCISNKLQVVIEAGPRRTMGSQVRKGKGRGRRKGRKGKDNLTKGLSFCSRRPSLAPNVQPLNAVEMALKAHFQSVAGPNTNGVLVLFLSPYFSLFLPPALHSSQTRPLPRSCSTCFLARSLASRDSSLTFSSDPLLGLPSSTRTSPSGFPLAPCRRLGSRRGTGSGQAASRSCSGQLWHCLGPQGDACPRKRMPARGRARPCP